jgi:hypothetical protein
MVTVGQIGDLLERLLGSAYVQRLLFYTQIAIVVFVVAGAIIAVTKL